MPTTYEHTRSTFADEMFSIDETLVHPPRRGKFNEGRRHKPPKPRWQRTLEEDAAVADANQRRLRAEFYERRGCR